MPERSEVIRILQNIHDNGDFGPDLIAATGWALRIIQEQDETIRELRKKTEAVKPKEWIPRNSNTVRGYYCLSCNTSLVKNDKYCHECGRFLIWDT